MESRQRVQRLYSTFAGGWPGAGLLLLRVVVGTVLLADAGLKLSSGLPLQTALVPAALAGSGLLLIAGLWTPLAGTAVAGLEISQALTSANDPLICLMTGTVGAALALLGPGRLSVDARLFGWKRIQAPAARQSFERALNFETSTRPNILMSRPIAGRRQAVGPKPAAATRKGGRSDPRSDRRNDDFEPVGAPERSLLRPA
jgi:hypothetical protein